MTVRKIGLGIGGMMPVVLAALVPLWIAGCDWFEPQPEENYEPTTDILRCPGAGGVNAGGSVTIVWRGDDKDGSVASYDYSYDQSDWASTPDDSLVIESVTLGEHTFRVRAVDDKGEADASPAECEFVAGQLVDRSLLVEFITTSWCQNCPKAEEALDSLITDFGSDRLAVVAYHDMQADGLATVETGDRIDWYTSFAGIPPNPIPADQYPISVFDGQRSVEGANSVDQVIAEYTDAIERRLAQGSPVGLTIDGEIGSSFGSVEVTAKVTGVVPAHQLLLRFAVIEDDVWYPRYVHKIFDAVGRDLLDDEPLAIAAIGDSVSVPRTFPVAETWTLDKLDVIAFIQDVDTREVLQSVRLRAE